MTDLPTWAYALFTTIVSGALSTLVGLLIKNAAQKKFDAQTKKNQEYEELKHKQRTRERREEMSEIVDEALKPVVARIDGLEKKVDIIQKDRELEKNATVVTMRVKMMELHDIYVKRGWCDSHEKSTWEELYSRYKDLGGNHFLEYVNVYKADIEKLPTEKKTSKKK